MRQQPLIKTLTRRFWIGLMLSTLPLSGCSIGLRHDLNSEKAQMEKMPTVAQWSAQLNATQTRLIAYYRKTYPKLHISTPPNIGTLACSLTPHSDIGGGAIAIQGAADWFRGEGGSTKPAAPIPALEAAMARYYAPLGFHVNVVKGVRYPAQLMGPGNAQIQFDDNGSQGWAISVDAGCRMYTHDHPNAPATKQ